MWSPSPAPCATGQRCCALMGSWWKSWRVHRLCRSCAPLGFWCHRASGLCALAGHWWKSWRARRLSRPCSRPRLRTRPGLRRSDRPDRVFSQPDGIFCFVDLPPGLYRLRVSAPEMGSRYGAVEIGPFEVQAAPVTGPFPVARADVDLPPTRIHGVITDAVTGKPIPATRVRLLGDTTVVKTGDDGAYDLSRQIAGKPTLQVTASRFQSATRRVELAAGQERVEDFALQPE